MMIDHLPRPRNQAGRDLKAAIGVGVGLAALVLVCIFVIPGGWGWYGLVAGAIGVATWEVQSRLRENGYLVSLPLLLVCGQAMVWSSRPFGLGGVVSAFAVSILALMFGRLFVAGRNSAPTNYLRDTAMGIFVLAWIPLFGSFAAMLAGFDVDGVSPFYFIVTFMLCVIASDTGGYIAGVMLGKTPLAPAVSPSKSIEGFVGSIVLSVITGSLAVGLLLGDHWWNGAILGVGLALCATLGDLVESQFKRELGIKDMSSILPGHGGLMDRLDGMLPAAMVTWLILTVMSTVS